MYYTITRALALAHNKKSFLLIPVYVRTVPVRVQIKMIHDS